MKNKIISALKKVIASDEYYNKILKGYLNTMLWSESDFNGESLDKKYDIEDISEEVIEQSKKDIKKFCEEAEKADVDLTIYDTETIGHDLWLTRNGHGAGFWDGDYEGNDGKDGKTLTKISKTLGSKDPYVGDDGKIYLDF